MSIRFLSLFSGIEAASVAWEPLGWRAAAFSEIDPFASAVLAHHYPRTPNLGDVCSVTDAAARELGVDLVVGGFPCQDLSVAGKRAGLNDKDGNATRSGLFFEALRVARATGARWLVLENVPGLFSSSAGRDFAAVVGALVGCEFDVPAGGWRSSGAAVGPAGLCEWCVLDAQFFGLAQRRKRVFLVCDFGNWRCRPPVLLEPASMRGDSPPSRETREAVARPLAACAPVGSGYRNDADTADNLIAGTLSANRKAAGSATQQDAHAGLLTTAAPPIAMCLNAGAMNRFDGESETLIPIGGYFGVAHTLKGEGFDASEDGTGRGQENAVMASGVRRLMPVECERLQGFPDGYTDIPYRGKPAADGPRYRALGNSMAVPVMHWIGKRIELVRAEQMERAA